jgi:hypothetical protein
MVSEGRRPPRARASNRELGALVYIFLGGYVGSLRAFRYEEALNLRSIGGDGRHSCAAHSRACCPAACKRSSRLATARSRPRLQPYQGRKHFLREPFLINRPDQMPPALTDGGNYQPCISHDGKMADGAPGFRNGIIVYHGF